MESTTLDLLKKHLRPGRVYRREGLMQWSNSVDRHLKALTDQGVLKKLRTGIYYCPRKFEFGDAPAEEHALIQAFLRTDQFVVMSPNDYNRLGLGTTQLYNKRIVYNQKRHGTFDLGGSTYVFQRRMNVPKKVTQEFMLVDLVNELDQLAEDKSLVLGRVLERAKQMHRRNLVTAVSLYGSYSTRKYFQELLKHD